MQVQMSSGIGHLEVRTTSNGGFTPEELAQEALDRILYIGESTHPAIRDQAIAFREQIRAVLVTYMKRAVTSDRTTLKAKLKAMGHADLAALLEN
jgi:hypothetical protein